MTMQIQTLKKHLVVLCVVVAPLLLIACNTNGERASSGTQPVANQPPILEVISASHEKDKLHIMLVEAGGKKIGHFTAVIDPTQHSSIKQGSRVRIAGDYAESEPVQIVNIRHIQHAPNSDKTQCEASKDNRWIPQGKAQLPACVTTYTDGGKSCSASSQCQGDCLVSAPNAPAFCAKTNSQFGCRATIEAVQAGQGILCVD